MGTPEFALESLRQIIAEGFRVVCVITAPDKPAGRGKKIKESAVKKYALSKDIPVLQPVNLKDKSFLEQLKAYRPHLNVVVAFRMLPETVWAMPPEGTINLHASLLPDYRGAAPINRAIMNGESLTGVSTFFIEKEIDTGNLILQREVPVTFQMNAGELHDLLMTEGAKLLTKTLELILRGEIKPSPQPKKKNPKTAPKIHPGDCKIPWKKDVLIIYNHIRGLSPYPGAWTEVKTGDHKKIIIKILAAEVLLESHNYPVGTLIALGKSVKIAVNKGYINIIELQVPGKRRMFIKDFLLGNSIDSWEITVD